MLLQCYDMGLRADLQPAARLVSMPTVADSMMHKLGLAHKALAKSAVFANMIRPAHEYRAYQSHVCTGHHMLNRFHMLQVTLRSYMI